MASRRLRCWECGIAFYGRADAHYCGGACRQKAHRSRTRRRAAEKTVPKPQHSHALARHNSSKRQPSRHAPAPKQRGAQSLKRAPRGTAKPCRVIGPSSRRRCTRPAIQRRFVSARRESSSRHERSARRLPRLQRAPTPTPNSGSNVLVNPTDQQSVADTSLADFREFLARESLHHRPD
jgi:hypothetical protein